MPYIGKVARLLTEWENWQTDSQYHSLPKFVGVVILNVCHIYSIKTSGILSRSL